MKNTLNREQKQMIVNLGLVCGKHRRHSQTTAEFKASGLVQRRIPAHSLS